MMSLWPPRSCLQVTAPTCPTLCSCSLHSSVWAWGKGQGTWTRGYFSPGSDSEAVLLATHSPGCLLGSAGSEHPEDQGRHVVQTSAFRTVGWRGPALTPARPLAVLRPGLAVFPAVAYRVNRARTNPRPQTPDDHPLCHLCAPLSGCVVTKPIPLCSPSPEARAGSPDCPV